MENEIREATQTAIEFTEHIIGTIEGIVHDFRIYNDYNAFIKSDVMFENLGLLIDAIQAIKIGSIDVTELVIHSKELESAFLNTDYLLMADIMEYDLIAMLEDWLEKIKEYFNS